MFKKIRTTMLALAAVASLGIAALVTTTESADAARFGGGFRAGGGHVGMRHVGGGRHFGGMRHIGHRPHIGIRHGHFRPHFHRHRHVHIRPHWCGRFHHRCRIHVRWPRPVIYGAPVVAAATYAVAPRVTNACTCLRKEYTQDGLVVFNDVCTKEVAAAPAGNTTLPPAGQSSTYPQPAPQTQLDSQGQPQVR